ncbi:MAG: T9SS type A sorting domain-containing protein [Saprospiraceae bacterium]|nr:T9SS type A sorting domain-containing protein [Saprospiraceae bacterium]
MEYVYNPAINVNEAKTTILAALVFESSTNTSNTIYNDAYNDYFPDGFSLYEDGVFLNQSIEDGVAPRIDKEIYRTPYMPLECLGNYTVTFMTDTSGIGANNIPFQYTRPVTPYLQLMIFYEFNELGRSGEANKDIQILTYPLDKVGTPIEEYSEALPFQKTIPAMNYTQNEVIEAMGVVIISGNLSANQGVQVDIIANSIVILDGVEIGQGINLISGAPSICGAKIPKSTMNLTTFCEGSNYKGHTRKNLALIEPTPKPKEKGDFSLIAYPNPFSSSTTIAFSLENQENVTLKLFNALGVQVESIMEQETLSAGTYKRATRSDLASGIYFAILQTANGTQTIKIIKQ